LNKEAEEDRLSPSTMLSPTQDQERKCRCVHHVDKDGREQQQHQRSSHNNGGPQSERLDSSFVHLPAPLSTKATFFGSPLLAGMDTNHGFGRAHDHICTLLDAMEDCTGKWKGDGGDGHEIMECFCTDCVERSVS